MTLESDLRAILRRYGVRSHYRARTEAGAPQYALFRDGKQVGEPATHSEVRAQQEAAIIADIIEIIGDAK